MTYFIFLRHSEKEYKNNRGPEGKPRHDPPIKEGFENLIIYKSKKNFLKYGYPQKIISSPFLRTRQTSEIIKNYITKMGKETEYIIDKDVEEYLGFQKPYNGKADLDIETSKYTQPLLGVENFQSLKFRAVKFYEDLLKKRAGSEGTILIITHGIFISKLATHLNLKHDSIKELEGIVVKGDIASLL